MNSHQSFQDVEPEYLRKHSLQGGLITLANQAVKFLLQTGSTMILARLLTPADFGIVAMVSSLLGFVNLLKDFGLSTASIQKPSLSKEELSNLFWLNFLSGVAVMLLLAAFSPMVAVFFNEPKAREITVAFGVVGMISSLGSQHSALMLRQMKFRALAFRDLLALVVGILFGIGSAYFGFGFWALIIMQLANTASGTFFLWWKSGWRAGRPQRTAGFGKTVKFGGSITIANFLGYANHNLDNILLGKFFGDVAVGFYSRAQGLLNKPLEQILPPIMRVAMPMFSRLAGDPQKFKSAALQLTEIVCFGGSLITMLVIPTADWVVRLLLGNQWSESVPVFQLLAIFGLMEPLAWLLGTIIVAFGMPGAMAKWRAISMIVVLISFILGLPWGILGVAAGYTLSGILTRTWLIFFVGKRIGISGWEFLAACRLFVILGGSIALGLWALRYVWEPSNSLLALSIYAFCGAFAYLILLTALPQGRKFLMRLLGLAIESFKLSRRGVEA